MKSTDYLITGASGFLGRVIMAELAPHNTISTLGRSVGNSYSLDLSKKVPVFHESFATIIHASGKAHVVPKSKQEAQDFFDVNVQGTVNLLAGISQASLPTAFLFISTVAVYGMESGLEIAETHQLLGASPYAKSKIDAEKIVQQWCSQHNVLLTILRLPLVVGNNPPGNLGMMIKWMKRGLYVGIGSGQTRKSMVLAEDVAHFIPIIKRVGGTYNLTDGVHPSMMEIENAIALALRKRKPLRFSESWLRGLAKVGDVMGDSAPLNTNRLSKLTSTLTFSDGKARKEGWRPRSVVEYITTSWSR
jgi:nucleoside-diphosphate-sugar epimerase